jgi:hypothetical protein
MPSVGALRRPNSSFGGLDVDKDANPGRGQRRSVEIDGTMHLGMGG